MVVGRVVREMWDVIFVVEFICDWISVFWFFLVILIVFFIILVFVVSCFF